MIFSLLAQTSTKQTIAIVSLDTKGLELDNEQMSNLVRLELEKIDRYEVLDKYDVRDAVTMHDIDPDQTFGKTKVIAVGKLLETDKMLTGSAERFGDKIIVILRLIDTKSERIEKTSVMEYLDMQEEVQTMVMISLNDLLDIENDPHLVDLLIDFPGPITSTKTTLSLNGPRIGATYTGGIAGKRLQASKDDGGYNMFPVTSMFGYQFEKQYLSAGDFQALVEAVVAINGLESGNFIPSFTFLNGFRFNNSGFEFGVGPIFRLVRMAEGYYDEDDNWVYMRRQVNVDPNIDIEEVIDNRGNLKPNIGLLVAVGKTFRSGYLNVPVNLYFSPRKQGSVIGVTFGFNSTRKPSF